MFRDILSSSRVIFIGLVFFVLVVGGSLLYSWHVHRTTDAEVAETQRKVQPLKNDKEARTAAGTVDTSTVDVEHTETTFENDDAQMSDDTNLALTDEASEVLDMADAFLPDDFVSEEEIAEDVPVSPYGFGPYPEVPSDFPGTPMWEHDLDALGFSEEQKKDSELLSRVLIKLWVEHGVGSRLGGYISPDTGLVYPYFEDTIYVRRQVSRNPDGTEGVVVAEINFPGNMSITSEETEKFRETGETPSGLQVLQIDTDGIDPYEFLNLQR